jgi:hypothetical protein
MKIALLQLPLQSHDYLYSLENVPLAPGYLASRLERDGTGAEVIICPTALQNLGGDAAVASWLEDLGPDVVGLSCSLWNVERSLNLCSMVKGVLKDPVFVLGGPEVTPDNGMLLGNDAFRLGVAGEGELAFSDLVRALRSGGDGVKKVRGLVVREGGRLASTGRRPLMMRLDDVPSPYLSGRVPVSPRKTMLIETVRGCPMRCSYCRYHKSAPSVRAFTVDRVVSEAAWGRDNGAGEFTVLDPCFARRPALLELLGALSRSRSGIECMSCELNAEDLTRELVDALVAAGLSHVETGLQSTNGAALRMVGRRFVREAFVAGVRMLRNSGVKVKTDIMVGLPGDRLEDVKRSVAFVLENGLCDELGIYPVSVLPGTTLKARARSLGIVYMDRPPYLVKRTETMDSGDIKEAFLWCEEAAGLELFPVEMPLMGMPSRGRGFGFVQRIVLADHGEDLACDSREIGQALCIELRARAWMERGDLTGKLGALLRANPFTIVSWIVPAHLFLPGRTLEWIGSVSGGRAHPLDREYMSSFTTVRSCQVFLEVRTRSGLTGYVMVPVEPCTSGPLWAALPEEAGAADEEDMTGVVTGLLGAGASIRFHDLEETAHGWLGQNLRAVESR